MENQRAMSDILIKFPDTNRIHSKEELIDQLKTRLKDRVKEAWLFGSAARGAFHRRSDVDLILVTETNLSFHERINEFADSIRLLFESETWSSAGAFHDFSADQFGRAQWFFDKYVSYES